MWYWSRKSKALIAMKTTVEIADEGEGGREGNSGKPWSPASVLWWLGLGAYPPLLCNNSVSQYWCLSVRVPSFSRVWLFVTPWTVAHQAPLSMGISQARILEWVAISFSRESSRPRDGTYVSCVSCIGRWVLYHCTTWEARLKKAVKWFKMKVFRHCGWPVREFHEDFLLTPHDQDIRSHWEKLGVTERNKSGYHPGNGSPSWV